MDLLLSFSGCEYLLFNIYHATKNEEGNVSSTNQKIDILQRLEADEISIKGKLSSEIKEGYYLAAVPTNMNEAVNTAKEKTVQPSTAGQTLLEKITVNSFIRRVRIFILKIVKKPKRMWILF